MVIYEVNLSLDPGIEGECLAWLRPQIFKVLQSPGFLHAHLYSRPEDSQSTGKREWTVHYHVATETDLKAGFEAAKMTWQQDGVRRFGAAFAALSRLLYPTEVFR